MNAQPTPQQVAKLERLCLTQAFAKLIWPVGAFDGGCLLVALSLQRVLGGELYALWSKSVTHDQPEHALVRFGDMFLDADGLATATELTKNCGFDLRHSLLGPVTLEQCLAHGCGVYEDGGGAAAVEELAEFFRLGFTKNLLEHA